ncbi:WecB/TagA/CpsF family glycosyltransferase [Jatrophihabitans sp. YIM 134969]
MRARPAEILGVPVDHLDRAAARSAVTAMAARPGHDVVAFVNAHSLNLAAGDLRYRASLHHASLVLNDGLGIGIAARLQGAPFTDNLNGTDLLPDLLSDFAADGHTVFFYGAAPGVAERTARRWALAVPGLRVAGALDGYTVSSAAAAEIVRESAADVVLVALGNPRQEIWARHLGPRTGARLSIGVGAFFDFSAGVVRRAPRVVRHARMEWAFRLLQEPRRLTRRYLVGNPAFLLRVAMAQVVPVRPLPTADDRARHPSARRSAPYRHGTSDVVVPGPWTRSPDDVERAG